MLDTGGIHIGNDVLRARGVGIYTPNHSVHAAESAAGGCFPRQVRIASRVWIGTGCHQNPGVTIGDVSIIGSRSEEHTSELQSQSNLVCRLLLEKKKKKKNKQHRLK